MQPQLIFVGSKKARQLENLKSWLAIDESSRPNVLVDRKRQGAACSRTRQAAKPKQIASVRRSVSVRARSARNSKIRGPNGCVPEMTQSHRREMAANHRAASVLARVNMRRPSASARVKETND